MRILNIILVLFLFSITTTAAIRYVSKTGSSTPPFTSWETASDSIQKCINICVFGDTIIVANGRYNEALVVNVDLTLIGSSMDSCIIDGTGFWAVTQFTIDVYAKLKISGFTILPNRNPGVGCSVFIEPGHSCEIDNCRIIRGTLQPSWNADLIAKHLVITETGGWTIFSLGNLLVVENTIIVNERDQVSKVGIYSDVDSAKIVNNIIIGIRPGSPFAQGSGIRIETLRKAYIANNIVSGFYPNIEIYNYIPNYTGEICNNLTCYYIPDSIGQVSGL